jgi:hypothetical protein
MARLIVEATASIYGFPGPASEDVFNICLSVTDATGKPITDVARADVTLIPLENSGGEISSLSQAATGSGVYVTVVRAGPPGTAFANGMSGYGVIVRKGADRGQTVVEATFSGRP